MPDYGKHSALDYIEPAPFWAKVTVGDLKDCWPWLGAVMPTGYGTISLAGLPTPSGFGSMRAHRAAWELWNNERIPVGLTIDHVCRTRICCNPDHLEPVTVAENYRRARSVPVPPGRGHGASIHRREQNGVVAWRVFTRFGGRQRTKQFAALADAVAFRDSIRTIGGEATFARTA